MATPKRSPPRNSSEGPPRKRQNTTSTPNASYSYPYTPSSVSGSTPYPPCPSDSPSNPFGRRRTWNLINSLPPPSSYSQHLPLRFQFLRRGAARSTRDGIYRIVQVPQSYTLVHLRSLIGFLFGGGYGQLPPDPDEEEETGSAHLFEIKHGLPVRGASQRPGQIKSGSTWAFSSSALDPYLYCPDWDAEDDSAGDAADPGAEDASEPAEDERKWTAEEDLTVAHVWPEGGDLSRGILYQHSQHLQIHITVNTTPITKRRGWGCVPHVFNACGLVYLDAPAEEDELEDEDPTALLSPENWNDPEDAFAKYYARTVPSLRFPSGDADPSSSPPVPALTFSSSPLRASSSSSHLSSSPQQSFAGSSSPPKYTPAPRPAQRKRIRHLQRRIGHLTRMQAEEEERKRTERLKEERKQRKPTVKKSAKQRREYSLEL